MTWMIEAQTVQDGKQVKVMIPAPPEMVAEAKLELYLLKAALALIPAVDAKEADVRALATAKIADLTARTATAAKP